MKVFHIFRNLAKPQTAVAEKESPKKIARPHPKFRNELGDGNFLEDLGATSISGRAVTRRGTENQLTIGSETKFDGTVEILGSKNRIIIGKNCHFRGQILVKGENQTVIFGDHSTSVGLYILCSENCDVSIGKWCMFSRQIEVRTTDAHSVIDRATGKRLNKPGSIDIKDHVWVSLGVMINRGVLIGADNIIAAKSFVNQSVDEEGTVIAGSPAKVVKRGVTWNRSRRDSFNENQLDYWRE